jgi:hypothetical protein
MKVVEFENDAIRSRVKRRYDPVFQQLSPLGFEEQTLFKEVSGGNPFWLILLVLALPIMISRREVIGFEFPMSITNYCLLYINKKFSTQSQVYGLGETFYTEFDDGTLLISTNTTHTSEDLIDEENNYYRYYYDKVPVSELWDYHLKSIEDFNNQGKRLINDPDFQTFSRISTRSDQMLLKTLSIRPTDNRKSKYLT